MAGIYYGSRITIAASSSHSSLDGIFNHRSKWCKDRRQMLQIKGVLANGDQSQLYFSPIGIYDQSEFWIDEGPLAKRAWTLQERFLSPRILHFTNSQLIWECDHALLSEDNLAHDRWARLLPLSLPNLMTPSRLMNFWYENVVESYCGRQLSDGSDKFVALSALAKVIQSLCDDEYLAGLWRGSLIQGLLWTRRGRGKKTRRPSWSWSSQDSSVRYITLEGLYYFDCRVRDVQVIKDPLNPLGNVTHGSSCLSCRICDCQMLQLDKDSFGLLGDDLLLLVWDGYKSLELRASMDSTGKDHRLSRGFLLYLGHELPFLVLAAVDLRTNTYERIGIVEVLGCYKDYEDVHKFLSERPKKIITIV